MLTSASAAVPWGGSCPLCWTQSCKYWAKLPPWTMGASLARCASCAMQAPVSGMACPSTLSCTKGNSMAYLHSLLVESGAQAEEDALPGGVKSARRVEVQGPGVLLPQPQEGVHLGLARGCASEVRLGPQVQSRLICTPSTASRQVHACRVLPGCD